MITYYSLLLYEHSSELTCHHHYIFILYSMALILTATLGCNLSDKDLSMHIL